jgi:hypothetical protein
MWKRLVIGKRIAIVFAVLIAAGCQSKNVNTDYDTSADFSQLRRYQFQDDKDNVDKQFEPLLSGRVKNALEQSLAAQFNLAKPNEAPDFRVRYFVKPVEKKVDDRPKLGIGLGGFGGNVGGGISLGIPLGGNKLDQQAQIVVDFVHPTSGQLLWRGNTVVGLSSSEPETNDKQVQQGVNEILKEFPPKAK